MTTLIASPTSLANARNGHPMKRIWNVTRLNFVNRWTVAWIPLMILGFIWLLNIAIWWIIAASTAPEDRADAFAGTVWSGSSFYIYVYMLIIATQAVNLTFPYALGLSVTRREFSLGTALSFVLLSMAYGILLTLLSYVEEWTNGWGFGGHMFTAVYFSTGNLVERFFTVTASLLFFFLSGAVWGTIYMRWRTNGMLVAGAIMSLAVVGAIALVTFTESWPLVGQWFMNTGPRGFALWLLAPAVLSAIIGYVALSRATPKN